MDRSIDNLHVKLLDGCMKSYENFIWKNPTGLDYYDKLKLLILRSVLSLYH